MNIAVYSGSFNPLHKGHEAIIRFLTREAGFDLVYLVVTPQNPFKQAHTLPTGQGRYEAALEAIARHPDLKVKAQDIELTMTPPQYTIRTLDALKEREPEHDFTLIIGADNLENFAGWRFHERILLEYGVAVPFASNTFVPTEKRPRFASISLLSSSAPKRSVASSPSSVAKNGTSESSAPVRSASEKYSSR
jgi:nicotinate-nucleotide adenylyltransferase